MVMTEDVRVTLDGGCKEREGMGSSWDLITRHSSVPNGTVWRMGVGKQDMFVID